MTQQQRWPDGLNQTDVDYLSTVHDELMKRGHDTSLSNVIWWIDGDEENRPQVYSIHELKFLKEEIIRQDR